LSCPRCRLIGHFKECGVGERKKMSVSKITDEEGVEKKRIKLGKDAECQLVREDEVN
jgi:hypothetical protein